MTEETKSTTTKERVLIKPAKDDKPFSQGLLAKLKRLGMPIKRHEKASFGRLEEALPFLRIAEKNKER